MNKKENECENIIGKSNNKVLFNLYFGHNYYNSYI